MRIRALGHAGLQIESSSATLLLDPWLSPFGAFQSSWFPYPDNEHLLDASLLEPTAVCISHEHLDHLDPWFLARVADSAPVLFPHYPADAVRKKLEGAGRARLVELEPWRRHDAAPGTQVMFVSEVSPMNHDSAVVVLADGRVVLDLNDARLTPQQIHEIRTVVGGHIDVLTIQGSSATWHPMQYELPDARKRALIRQKRAAKLRYVEKVVAAARPSVVVPFAGPPCFLDDELFELNHEMEGGLFPDQRTVADWLRARQVPGVVVLLPGDTLDTATGEHTRDARSAEFETCDRWEYLRVYAKRRADAIEQTKQHFLAPAGSLWEPFRRYFEELLSISGYFDRRIAMRVGFDLVGPGGGEWAVDFREETRGVYEDVGDCAYRLRFATRWLPSLLDGRLAWEDFFLSMRFTATREPDIYNDYLLGLLKFAHADALHAVEQYDAERAVDDRITISADGVCYSVQRYCPHAGADLSDTSEVLPGGVLRCLNHYYEFDLDTGQCLNGASAPLDSRKV